MFLLNLDNRFYLNFLPVKINLFTLVANILIHCLLRHEFCVITSGHLGVLWGACKVKSVFFTRYTKYQYFFPNLNLFKFGGHGRWCVMRNV